MTAESIGWEYLYAEFALGKDGYVLLTLNDAPSAHSHSFTKMSERLGEQNWELISSFPGRRSVAKRWSSLNDVMNGNTNNIIDVIILVFKRALTAERIQDKRDQQAKRKADAAAFLKYLRDGGVQLELQAPNELRVRRGRLSTESQEKLDAFKPELVEILAAQQ